MVNLNAVVVVVKPGVNASAVTTVKAMVKKHGRCKRALQQCCCGGVRQV
jgi:hypothetical protein